MKKTKFLHGDKLKVTDFVLAGFFNNVICNKLNPQHAGWMKLWDKSSSTLKKYVADFEEEMKDYMAMRPQYSM